MGDEFSRTTCFMHANPNLGNIGNGAENNVTLSVGGE